MNWRKFLPLAGAIGTVALPPAAPIIHAVTTLLDTKEEPSNDDVLDQLNEKLVPHGYAVIRIKWSGRSVPPETAPGDA